MRKGRFIIISIMPFVLLSILIIPILSAMGALNGLLAFLIVINAAGASVDFLNIMLVLRQVPRGGMVVSNGIETYFTSPQ